LLLHSPLRFTGCFCDYELILGIRLFKEEISSTASIVPALTLIASYWANAFLGRANELKIFWSRDHLKYHFVLPHYPKCTIAGKIAGRNRKVKAFLQAGTKSYWPFPSNYSGRRIL